MPFVGYMILFNDKLVDALKLVADVLPSCADKACVVALNLANLYQLYFGLMFIGVASFIYQLVCHPHIKRFDSAEAFTLAVRGVATTSDLLAYHAVSDRILKHSSTRDFVAGELGSVDSEAVKLGILNEYYRALDVAHSLTRGGVSLLYGIGLTLTLAPSLRTAWRIISSLDLISNLHF
ncbi:hypothetical protein LRC39_04725 [Rhodopseudomonas sp. P1]|uniref:hypothetical protein n=1 Tax=Rhodopseudomonas TaxID=1073 RepID=UPI000E5C24A0|nr:hypothetical protein [Rhodopseudomonas palustris]QLH70083.1 hypothetical protein HZF03_04510 [Rhodopseudomonas palustris]RHZ97969.1 hypothetical protein D1920_16570 [Rhodopseudomonas palustris]